MFSPLWICTSARLPLNHCRFRLSYSCMRCSLSAQKISLTSILEGGKVYYYWDLNISEKKFRVKSRLRLWIMTSSRNGWPTQPRQYNVEGARHPQMSVCRKPSLVPSSNDLTPPTSETSRRFITIPRLQQHPRNWVVSQLHTPSNDRLKSPIGRAWSNP